MSEMTPPPEQIKTEQLRIILVAYSIEAGAFATVGAVAGGSVGGAIEAHYIQEEMPTSTTGSRHPETPFSPIGAGVGAGVGVTAALIMCWSYIHKNRFVSTNDSQE